MQLSKRLSGSITARFINSNLTDGLTVSGVETKPGRAVAVDLGAFYKTKSFKLGEYKANVNIGMNVSNIGNKVSYTNSANRDFLPSNLRLGSVLNMDIDQYNQFSIGVDLNKLLVPTPDPNDPNANDNIGWVEGIFSSFGDAPGGFSEEIKEFTYALGAEYLYDNAFAVRAGYFHESVDKGNRQYFTLGGGFKTNALNIDLSYLINASDVNNPLENSLRFSISFDLGEIYDDY